MDLQADVAKLSLDLTADVKKLRVRCLARRACVFAVACVVHHVAPS